MIEMLSRRFLLQLTGAFAVGATAVTVAKPMLAPPPVPVPVQTPIVALLEQLAAPPLTIVFYSKDGIRVGETAIIRADASAIVQDGAVQVFAMAPFTMIASKVVLEREGRELFTLNESFNLTSGMMFTLRIELSTSA